MSAAFFYFAWDFSLEPTLIIFVQKTSVSNNILEICFQQYYKIRSQAINALKVEGDHPYPHKFHVSISLKNYIAKYDSITTAGEWLDDIVSVSGMIILIVLIITRFSFLMS